MNKAIWTFFFVLISSSLLHGERIYKFDGIFHQLDKRRILSTLLPYNPRILAFTSDATFSAQCSVHWPNCTIIYNDSSANFSDSSFDLLWIESDGNELEVLYENAHLLSHAKAIYTSTHFFDNGIHYQNLRLLLELAGFHQLAHWYWEGEYGNAIYIKKNLYDAAMRCWNYSPNGLNRYIFPSVAYEFGPFLKKADDKSEINSIEEIDFIYMINLDERPEKFAESCLELHPFNIYPYRFSAVNGWKLPITAFSEIGVKFLPGTLQDQFMGTTFKEANGKVYRSNELIQENGTSYFGIGMINGSVGIVLSHLSVLQDAYDSGFNTIWVMEDDVEAVNDPTQIPELIHELDLVAPDWDILFTDTDTKDTYGNHIPCRALGARLNFNIPPLSTFLDKFYQVNDHFSSIGMRYGAYSMIVRRSGMKKILDYFKTYGVYLPYDMDFWLVPSIKMYCVTKDIVSHKAGAATDNHAPQYAKKKEAHFEKSP